MKKAVSLLLTLVLGIITISLPFSASAATVPAQMNNSSSYVQYYSDGSYLKVTISSSNLASYSLNSIMTADSAYQKYGSKTGTYYNSDNVAMFSFTVNGTYQYVYGSYSTCIDSSYSTSISDKSWKVSSASSYCSGGSAIGDALFKRYFLFVAVDNQPMHLELYCDAYGNLS